MGELDGEERRYSEPRKHKIGPNQEHAIRIAAARGSSLRGLAAENGVSHQTIASILRAQAAAAAHTAMVAD